MNGDLEGVVVAYFTESFRYIVRGGQKNLTSPSEFIWFSDQDLTPGPLEYEARMLTSRQQQAFMPMREMRMTKMKMCDDYSNRNKGGIDLGTDNQPQK